MALNRSIAELPEGCEVLVVGAGPAGSAAARTLASAGVDVLLVDQHAFPRDKVCGDALIPDAHAALKKLGVFDRVMGRAQPVSHVACVAPRGGRVEVPGNLSVLPRKELDDMLASFAGEAGAHLHAPIRFMEAIERNGRVVGASLLSNQGDRSERREVRARWVLLATGAVPQALMAAGMCSRQTPSGVALRGYVRNDAMKDRIKAVEIIWNQALRPGYGWIFPCPDGVFNIGVGLMHSHENAGSGGGHHAKQDFNLRGAFDAFTKVYEPARELVRGGVMMDALKGAPLRCTLEGARYSRPGLMVTGEAAGSTYAFTGEGIGKALETGIAAAEAILAGGRSGDSGAQHPDSTDAAVRADYESRLLALKPRFQLYERANLVNRHPLLSDLLVWRARKNARVRQRMSDVLDESANPGTLVSLRGIFRLFGK